MSTGWWIFLLLTFVAA